MVIILINIVSLALITYGIYYLIKSKTLNNKVVEKLLNEDHSDIELEKLKRQFNFKQKKENKIIKKFSLVIKNANIKKVGITPKTLIIGSAILGVISLEIFKDISNIQVAIIPSIFVASIPYFILYFISEKRMSMINEQLVDFINLLKNYLELKDDINYALYEIAESDSGELSDYCKEYVFKTQHGLDIFEALLDLESKVDNIQFKFLIKALISCNLNSAKYLETVKIYGDNYLDVYDKYLEKKSEARQGRLSILTVIIVATIALYPAISHHSSAKEVLLNSVIGNFLLIQFEVVFVIVFKIVVNLGKFSFD